MGVAARRAIYVNWDGFAWDYYVEARRRPRDYPGLERLRTEGVVFTQAATGLPSLTVPMQTTLVSGAWPAGHGNPGRHLDPNSGRIVEGGWGNAAETMAEAARRAGRRVVSVNQFTLKGRGTALGDPESPYLEAGRGFRARFAAAQRSWAVLKPDLLCLYCDDLDAVGHNLARATNRIPRAATEERRRANVLRQLRMLDRELFRWMRRLAPGGGPPHGIALALATDHGMTPFFGRSSLPQLRERLAAMGLPAQVYAPGDTVEIEEGLALVTFGLELQVYLRGPVAEGGGGELARRLAQELAPEPWFGGVLDRRALLRRGAHPDFADLLLWPRPPHHFKRSSQEYPPRGQHDSPDPSSNRVFLALWGEGIRSAGELDTPVQVVDLAPTLAALLDIPPPRDAVGRVLREALIR